MDSGDSALRRPVDARALSRAARRLVAAPEAPWLHTEVARRMQERLSLIKQPPGRVLDWAPANALSTAALRAAYPQATITQVDPLPRPGGSVPVVDSWWARTKSRWMPDRAPALTPPEVAPGSADLLWANMLLHAVPEPVALLGAWRRALSPQGFLMFSTLGPGSLRQLASLYEASGWGSPMAPFVDMHDLGDMMVRAGLADPVMDQELVTLTWATPQAALAELRSLGANAALDRLPGLRTPRWRAQLERSLADCADSQGRVALTFELVYGHAFQGQAKKPGETRISVDDVRGQLRHMRSKPDKSAGLPD